MDLLLSRVRITRQLAEKQKSILTSFLKKAAPPAAEVKPVAVKNKEEEGDNLFHFHLLFKGVDVPPHTVRSSYLPTPVPGIGRLASHEIEAALVNNTGMCTRSHSSLS